MAQIPQHPNQAIALKEGDTALDFTLVNTDGQALHLQSHLAHRPLALVFYRGDW